MKNCFLFTIFTLSSVTIFGQSTTKSIQEYFVSDVKGNKISQGFTYLSSFNEFGVAVCVVGGTKQYGDFGSIINGKFGLIREDGTYVINPSYSYIEDFDVKSKRYLFSSDQKWGILDEKGKMIVEPSYDAIETSYYAPKKFIAKKTGTSAIILDHTGKVISKTCQEINSNEYGFQTLVNGQLGVLSNEGNEILPNIYSSISLITKKTFLVEDFQGNKFIVDDKNKQLTKSKYSDFKIIYENGAYYGNPIAYIAAVKGKFGLLDVKFNTIHPFSKDDMLGLFVNNTTLVQFLNNGKYGLLNLEGHEVVKPIYNSMSVVLEKILIVSKGGKTNEWGGIEGSKYGVIDEKGKERLKLIYDDVKMYYQNIFVLKLKDNWYAFDKNLNKLFSEGYAIIDQVSENSIIVNKGGQEKDYSFSGGVFGVYNLEGELVIPINYELIASSGYGLDQVFLAKKNGKYGIINQEGKVILEPTYEEINCTNEICMVGKYEERSTEMKYGLLYCDVSESNLITELKYDEIQKNLGDETYSVKIKSSWGVISKNGNEIIPTSHYFIEGSDNYSATDLYKVNELGIIERNEFDNSVTVRGGSFGLINNKNEVVLPMTYSELELYQDSLIIAKSTGTSQKVGIYNYKTKKWVIPMEYEYLKLLDYQNSLFLVANDAKINDWGGIESGKMGIIDLNNRIIVPLNYSEIKSENAMLICNNLDFSGFDLFDIKGNELLKDYDLLTSLDDTLVFCKRGKDVSIQNVRTKKSILSENYINGATTDYLSRYSNYSIAVQNANNKWGYVNKIGQTFIPCQYDAAKPSDEQFLIVAKFGEKNEFLYGVVDLNNEVIIPFEYENIEKEYGTNFLATKGNTVFKISSSNEILEKKPYSELGN
jgi:hypothetical protein